MRKLKTSKIASPVGFNPKPKTQQHNPDYRRMYNEYLRAWYVSDDGVVADCVPRTVRLFKVSLDSQGYDNGGAYWGHGQQLWCAIGEHEAGIMHREFIRADSREDAIIGLSIEAGLLIQEPTKKRLDSIFYGGMSGNKKARKLYNSLYSLGYDLETGYFLTDKNCKNT